MSAHLRRQRRAILVLLGAAASSCFNPDEPSETAAGTEASTSTATTGSTGSEGPSSTSPSSTDSPSSGPTSTVPADESSSAAEDTVADTTGQPECDELLSPCPDGQYCVGQSCLDPPEGFVAVPPGTFMMGCNEALDANCADDEFPYHEIMLFAYAIGRTEVTAAEYQACVDAGACSLPQPMNGFGDPCDAGSGNLPVTCVNWFQAQDYCTWIDATLPTEAQWEKAARGTDGRTYPWGEDPPTCTLTNMSGCVGGMSQAVEVGTKPAGASPYGALDMSGNVFEWVADWYDAAYYVESPDTDPPGPANGTQRVLRSAASNYVDVAQRSAFRGVDFETTSPSDGNSNIGFRCAFNP